eukprot:6148908-Amphidinium_carterae.1
MSTVLGCGFAAWRALAINTAVAASVATPLTATPLEKVEEELLDADISEDTIVCDLVSRPSLAAWCMTLVEGWKAAAGQAIAARLAKATAGLDIFVL